MQEEELKEENCCQRRPHILWPFLLQKKDRGNDDGIFRIIKKNKDFQTVYRKGNSNANRYLVMYVLENHLNKNRLGISVSKKVGNSIVRHHLTRLIRESYRLSEDKFMCGYDIVVIARAGAKERTYWEIESALLHLGRLHKLVRTET